MRLKEGQLSRIEIKGFKSLQHCSVDFGKINVLIGSNGAGKSNFISVFELLESVVHKNLQMYAMKNGINTLFYNGRKTTERIALDVALGEEGYGYGFDLMPTNDYGVYLMGERFLHKREKLQEWTFSTVSKESTWDDERITVADEGEYARELLAQTSWRVYHFHDTDQAAKVKQETNIGNNLFLHKDAGNLAAILFLLKQKYEKKYREIVSTVQLIAPFFDDFVLEPQPFNHELIALRWKQKGCDDVFNSSQFSDGTLRFICLTVLLLQPKEMQPETIIIDEPELGLHPSAITLLATMIEQAAMDKQLILTTQSVELLNEFDPEDIIVVDRSSEGSAFRRLDSAELEQWLEEYTLGELWKKNLLGGRPTL